MPIQQKFIIKAQNGRYLIDGVQAPELELISGKEYAFDLSDSSLSSHPLAFKIDGQAWNEAVTVTGTRGVDQVVKITVPSASKGVLSYYCTNHSGMGNDAIIVANKIFGTDDGGTLVGLSGDDVIEAGTGDDTIDGGAGNDTLNGGAGNDTLLGDSAHAAYTFNAIVTKLDQDWTAIDLKRVDLTLGLNNDTPFKYSNGEIITFVGGEVVRMEIEHGKLYDTINFEGHNSSYEAYKPIISEYSNLSDERYIIIEQHFKLDGVNHGLLFEIYSEGDHFDNILTLDDWFDNSQRKSQDLPIISDYKAGAAISFDYASSQSLAEKNWVHTASNGDGDDTLKGGSGDDILKGGAGNDTIILESNGAFGSELYAYNVSSSLQTGTEDSINLAGKIRFGDVMDGGADVDTIELTDGSDAFFLHDSFGGFHSSLTLVEDYDSRLGTARIANIENINSGLGDDIVDLTSPDYSLAGQNITVDGGSGDDTLWGSDADETLKGGVGDDELFGGAGTNVLTGGAGADEFQFTKTSTNDTVKDFSLIDGDTLKFFNKGGALFDRDSVSLTGDVLSISDGTAVLTITLEGAGLQSNDLGSDVLIIG